MKSDGAVLVARAPVYWGKVVRLSVDRVRLPGGRETELETIQHPGAAAVAAVDAQGQVIMVRQLRAATSGWIHEVPAGKLDPGEPPAVCAARELEEEVGVRAARLESLGTIWTTPGFTDEVIHLFLATDLEDTEQSLSEHEVLEVERWPLELACERALSGEMDDAKSVCAVLRARAALTATGEGGAS